MAVEALLDFPEACTSSAVLVVDEVEGAGVAAFMDAHPNVCVGAGAAALEGLAPSSLAHVMVATTAPWEELLPAVLAALAPQGRIVVRQPASMAGARDDVSMALLCAGFALALGMPSVPRCWDAGRWRCCRCCAVCRRRRGSCASNSVRCTRATRRSRHTECFLVSG